MSGGVLPAQNLEMLPSSKEQHWRSRYRQLAQELEEKERAWAKLETALRSAAGKLAMAALGQSHELDTAIEDVMTALSADAATLDLGPSMTGLMRALKVKSEVAPNGAPLGASPGVA